MYPFRFFTFFYSKHNSVTWRTYLPFYVPIITHICVHRGKRKKRGNPLMQKDWFPSNSKLLVVVVTVEVSSSSVLIFLAICNSMCCISSVFLFNILVWMFWLTLTTTAGSSDKGLKAVCTNHIKGEKKDVCGC